MSAEPADKQSWTAEEYLAWERLQPGKHEYFQGTVSAMPRVALEHSLVLVGIASELGNALREGPCQVLLSNMRIKVRATGLYTYPDALVVCGKAELEDETLDTLQNPRVLVEVLSETSEAYQGTGARC